MDDHRDSKINYTKNKLLKEFINKNDPQIKAAFSEQRFYVNKGMFVSQNILKINGVTLKILGNESKQ